MKKVWIGLVVVLIGIQFIRIDTSNPESVLEQDFLYSTNPPSEIGNLIKTACYDCHSNNTVYPWYAQIAPVSWLVGHDIDEGREHLNFSEYGSWDPEKKEHKLEECAEELEEGEMPMEIYVVMHGEADLTSEQRESLIGWFEQERAKWGSGHSHE
ncbi:heme-binding domain-containing protein [bacterium SCSIO 12741]|nr:heme-binding domain-containing protein [bacterium SCSIO 12741]